MRDGSDAIADWPVLNALLNTSSGATWVSVHHGGGVGIGYSLHAGMVVVADGTREADEKLQRVLTCDPGIGVVRHADAGYPDAIATARESGIDMPMLSNQRSGEPADDDSRASLARAACARRPRRRARRPGPRIPVVLGGCGTGRTSLLLRLRDLIGRSQAQYVDVERIATTPERFLKALRESSPFPGPSYEHAASGEAGGARRVRRGARVPRHGARAGRSRRRRSCSTSSSSCARSRAFPGCAACCAISSARWRRAATASC